MKEAHTFRWLMRHGETQMRPKHLVAHWKRRHHCVSRRGETRATAG